MRTTYRGVAGAALGGISELVLFTAGLTLCAWWSINFTAGPSGFSMLWVLSGVLFGYLLTTPRRHWGRYIACAFLASVLANLQRNGFGAMTLLLGLANVADAGIAAFILTRRVPDVSRLRDIQRTLWVGGAAIVLACTLSAAIATIARRYLLLLAQDFDVLFETWFGSHILGLAIFGTLTVIVRVEGARMFGVRGQRFELLASLALVAASCWLTFRQSSFPVAFLVPPFLMLCVLRHRFSGFVPGMALIAMISTMATAAGHGPLTIGMGVDDAVERTRMLQLFILCNCFLSFPIAAVLTERGILARQVERSELLYRTLAEHARDLVLRIGSDRTVKFVSPSVTELLGWSREEFGARRWELVHPEDAAQLQAAMLPLFESGGTADVMYRIRHKQGHYLWFAASARSVHDSGTGEADVVYAGRDVTARVEAEQALDRLARQDALTGLANRLHFDERIVLAHTRAQRSGLRIGLLYFDVDQFKRVNDTHGHAVGDAVLREFARRIRGCLRAADFPARLGGDEFAVLVEDVESADGLQIIAEKLVAAMRDPMNVDGTRLRVSTSIGIGVSVPGGDTPEALMRLADTALYQAKAAGRDGWRLASA